MDEKTNVMRILDQKKIKYNKYCYADTDAISGVEVAEALGQNKEQVFKTLVTIGKSKNHYVFAIGMNKDFKTTIDKSVEGLDTFIFSAGKIGYQVEMTLDSLSKVIRVQVADLI